MKKKNKLNIVFEDKHLIVVYKDDKLPTIKSDKYKDSLYSKVYNYLHKKNQSIYVVHRIDKDTSGLVMFAKSKKVKEMLQSNWDKVNREYVCIVHGNTKDNGIIESFLKETKTLYTYSSKDKKGSYAKTEYKKIKNNSKYTLLNIVIKTGRKNQIRVHMKDNNTPILGDKKYGIKDGFKNMFLLAYKLEFIHPVTKEKIEIILDIPTNYLKLLNILNDIV